MKAAAKSRKRAIPPAAPLEEINLNETQFRAFIAQLAESAGSMSELARQLDVTGQFIGGILAGKKKPGRKFLAAIGARLEPTYTVAIERVDEPGDRSKNGK
jgi:hypothetical protein